MYTNRFLRILPATFFGLGLLIVFILGCAPKRDNPLDPEGEDYVTPEINFTFENNGTIHGDEIDTIISDSVSIRWGISNETIQYRYRIDNGEWSIWSETPAISQLMTEGNHILVVETQLSNGSAYSTDSIPFTVKSLFDKSIYLAPRFLSAGKTFPVLTVKTHAISEAAMLHMSFKGALIDSAWLGDSLKDKNLQLLYSESTIDIAVFPGDIRLAGDLSVASVRFKKLASDSAVVSFSECILRDSLNADLKVEATRGCLIIR